MKLFFCRWKSTALNRPKLGLSQKKDGPENRAVSDFLALICD